MPDAYSPSAEDGPANPARSRSQSQRVVEGLLERIRSGEWQPGQRVPTEPELMQSFGVSRSVVREAVSRLQASGVLRTRQGVGSFVLSAQPRSIQAALLQDPEGELKLRQKLAMLELRLSVETEAAALAAVRRTPEQLAAMEAALDDFDARQAAGQSTAEADFHFHELVAQATGNEYFVEVLRSLSRATIPRTPVRAPLRPTARQRVEERPRQFGEPTPALQGGKARIQNEHYGALDAIRRRDPGQARAAMYLHLAKSIDRLRAAVESQAEAASQLSHSPGDSAPE